MADDTFKIGVVKFGCIGAAPLLDLILDERADRKDLEVRVFTSGAKLDPDSCVGPTDAVIEYKPDLVLSVSPNAALPGPTASREKLGEAKLPTITISDGPAVKGFYKKNEEGKKVKSLLDKQGFIILPADSMIGARREFLDPAEMSLFNADVIKVLSATGFVHITQKAIDDVVAGLKAGEETKMPTLKVTAKKAVEAAGFTNPYAAAKAYAAITISEAVADVNVQGCFVEQDRDKYIPLVAAGHELMRAAAVLADEAREIEKYSDSIYRTPHDKKGATLAKTKLLDKPK
ncbi:MAG: F420-dependent methylenetetrahydromethanopterin dehydrogenase [Candidatus Thorarchaeota archaeon]|jgi:methylenetetrahydromethanopterin dehydrogenase